MIITFLGTGTSHGIPKVACECDVCKSDNPKNNRTRSSVYVEDGDICILIDTTTDFRFQAIRENIRKLDAVLYTHAHADHINGLDEIRVFNEIQGNPIGLYGSEKTINYISHKFDYCINPPQLGGGVPDIQLLPTSEPVKINRLKIMPIPAFHGKIEIYGYRINDFAYITDASFIPEKSFEKLNGVKTLVLNMLRFKPHPTHFSLKESISVSKRIGAEQTYFIHMCHDIEHETVNKTLPKGIQLAYDGLKLEI